MRKDTAQIYLASAMSDQCICVSLPSKIPGRQNRSTWPKCCTKGQNACRTQRIKTSINKFIASDVHAFQ